MSRQQFPVATILVVSLLFSLLSTAHARVTGFEVLELSDPAFDGREFAEAGQYRRISAKVSFAVDPEDAHNSTIVDIDKAPLNASGEVEFSTEVVILQPSDVDKANGKLFFEISNRGRNLSFALLNDSPFAPDPRTAEEAGNGFLLNQGYTVVWSGWQSGLDESVLNLTIPVAAGATGLSREEFVFDNEEPLSRARLSYPVDRQSQIEATLTVRTRESDQREIPEGLDFEYINEQEIEISRPAAVPAGAIYEFIYPARDSTVSGLGFAATRDLVSFLRGMDGHDADSPLTVIDHVLGIGISQAGRYARDFVYQGFNADENDKRVFDGLIVHIAGSRKTFTNYRFAQPGRYSRQHEDHAFPGDQFPFSYATTTDPLTGNNDGILRLCRQSLTCPRIMHSDTDTEFWQARASLVATDPRGQALPIPDDVRLYYLAGTQHFTIAGADISASSQCVFDNNVFHIGAVMRGLTSGLDAWVSSDKAPPQSRFPNRVGATLLAPEDMQMVAIPGLEYQSTINHLTVLDHQQMPPQAGAQYPIFVASTDTTGNVIDGIRLPRIAVPLGTHIGWNLRKAGFAEGELCSLSGSYIPFATEAATRDESDKRPTIDELYRDEAGYMAKIESAINDLLGQRLILSQDVDMLRERAAAHWRRFGQSVE